MGILTEEKPNTVHTAFQWIRNRHIESLNITVEEYRHKETGALHYHMASDNTENVFLVALRTVPTNSTGVAHILEHSALCGSKRFPVRDPFFMMIRRSLNTFMNAFTSSDWTAYPFASQNKKDYYNLLDVYLDAVFFSNLEELDFAQEGHRVEFEKADDPSTPLVFKGVVFNEMKGSMASPITTVWQTLTKYIFPTTTYHFNSGGDPESIPDLSYEALKAFYKTHYHPSNAVFMTYGDESACELQTRFEDLVLSQFKRLNQTITVNDEKRYQAPIAVEESYALDKGDLNGDKTHIIIGWLLGKSIDLEAQLRAHLLSGILLDNSASPLRQALETTDLGASPSVLCGLEDSNREMMFMCGLEGSKPENTAAVESLVFDVLERVADQGVPQKQVESVLHQLELEQREIGGGGYPYGLQLILDALTSALHRGDPTAALNIDPILKKLREEITDPDFIKGLIKQLLINNQHRVRLTMKPDEQLNARRTNAEAIQLAQMKDAMSETDIQRIIETTKKLEQRQTRIEDEGLLPKVDLTDIPEAMHIAEGESIQTGSKPATFYIQATNGLVYQQYISPMPKLKNGLLEILPYYTSSITELGCGGKDYLQTQAWQASISGGVNAFTTMRGHIDNVQDVSSYFFLSGKALARNHGHLSELMHKTLTEIRFDEHTRIRELIAQQRVQREQSVMGNGHGLAMLAASSGMSPTVSVQNRLSGLVGIQHIKQLDENINNGTGASELADKYQQLHNLILSTPTQFLLIGEKENQNTMLSGLEAYWASTSNNETDNFEPFTLPKVQQQIKELWITSAPINFCARAYATVPIEHEDAAALTVLGGFLRNGYLHRAIREQGGAYGGGANYHAESASFRFYSYRDPRLVDTLKDFDRSIEWVLSETQEWRQVEEAILGVISSIDKPASPSGEAKDAFQNNLYGRTAEQRQRHRANILKVTLEDLKAVAEKYFAPETASTAVITNAATIDQIGDLGFDVKKL